MGGIALTPEEVLAEGVDSLTMKVRKIAPQLRRFLCLA